VLEPAGRDIVHCSWVLHRLAAPSAELRNMARATRPGGQVVLQWSLTPRDGHLHAIQDVCQQLREHGLEIAIAEEDIELAGVDGYAGRVVAHRPAPKDAHDDAVGPPRVRAFPLVVGMLEVVEAVRLSPNMRRLVLTGEELAELPVREPGEMITLIWPAPGSAEIVLPQLRRWRFPEGGREQPARSTAIASLSVAMLRCSRSRAASPAVGRRPPGRQSPARPGPRPRRHFRLRRDARALHPPARVSLRAWFADRRLRQLARPGTRVTGLRDRSPHHIRCSRARPDRRVCNAHR
jgi:Siderophore-interacting FAD-binding domain